MTFRSCLLFASLLAVSTASHCLYDHKPQLKACVRKCRHSPTAGCVSGCVAGAPYFIRPTCAACLGNGVVCAYRSCRAQCGAGITAPGCTSCITRSCGTCGGAYKAANETEMAELAIFSLGFEPEAPEKAGEVKKEAEEETPKTETEVAPVSSKAGGCWEDRASLKYCGTKCFGAGNKKRCAINCLINERGMGRGCAYCFGDKVACTIKSCLSECMGQGPRCNSCVRSKCGRCAFEKSLSEADEDNFLADVIGAALPAGEEQAAIYP